MKKFFGGIALVIGIVFSLSGASSAADKVLKIGYVDINGAAAQSQWGKRVIDQLKSEQERLGKDIDQKGQTFKAAKDEFDKKRSLMDEKARERKQQELQGMASELEKLASDSSQKFNKDAADARTPLFQKIGEILQKIARDEKYDFILEKSSLPFAGESYDLTKKVSAELDKSSPK